MYRLLLPKMICPWHDGLLFKRHWQPARGRHTVRPVPPTGKLTSSDMRYPGYPAPKPQYLQNTSNLTQWSTSQSPQWSPVFIYRHKSKWPNYAIMYVYLHTVHTIISLPIQRNGTRFRPVRPLTNQNNVNSENSDLTICISNDKKWNNCKQST